MHNYHMLTINGVKQSCPLAAGLFRMEFDVLVSSAFKYNTGIFVLCHTDQLAPTQGDVPSKELNLVLLELVARA